MKLLEYEGKRILQTSGIPVPASYLAGELPEFLPVVLKSQVPVGGRGKAGGIVIAKSEDEYTEAIQKITELEIKGFTPRTILAEQPLSIDRELYLSLLIDRKSAAITIMANNNGGVEVEDNDTDSYWNATLDSKPDYDAIGQSLADYYDLSEQTFALQDIVEKLHKTFASQDMTLLEINPLILTSEGKLVAGDAKITLDDAATFRHRDWDFEEEKGDSNFVTLDEKGNVATIANGAGLAMATVDAVADAGLSPANFLDIGGGASEASVLAAFERLVEYPNLKVVIINIFAGITRCDEVAKAVIAAQAKIANLPPLAIRLAGTNYEQAAELLAAEDIDLHATLEDALRAAKELA